MREGCRAHHAKYRSPRADSAAHLARLRDLPTLHPGRLLCAPTTSTPTANTGVRGQSEVDDACVLPEASPSEPLQRHATIRHIPAKLEGKSALKPMLQVW